MKTKSAVRPREIQRTVLNLERLLDLERLGLGGSCVEVAIIPPSTSIAPHTTFPAANAPPSPPPAGTQRLPATAPSPPPGRPAGKTPAHHAAQTGATAPSPPPT